MRDRDVSLTTGEIDLALRYGDGDGPWPNGTATRERDYDHLPLTAAVTPHAIFEPESERRLRLMVQP
jgi:hypothetical protein